jgi:hypothetical protein
MHLFALCLNPLLRILDDNLPGIQLGRRDSKTAVIAYADDITIFLTSPTDIPVVQDAIRRYETASGARLNTRKSKAIALETWDTTVNVMDIPYYKDAKILGFTITALSNNQHSQAGQQLRA